MSVIILANYNYDDYNFDKQFRFRSIKMYCRVMSMYSYKS